MKRDAAELPKEALSLPTEARAALAEALFASLDEQPHDDVAAAWKSEIECRIAELETGAVSPLPWPEVRRRLFERARQRAVTRLLNSADLQWSPPFLETIFIDANLADLKSSVEILLRPKDPTRARPVFQD
jgi:putative addiction module component (TIGR02574 family)